MITETAAAVAQIAAASSSRSGGGTFFESSRPASRLRVQPLHVEADGGRHQRPGQAAAASLVGARHPPDAQLAVVAEQAAESGVHLT